MKQNNDTSVQDKILRRKNAIPVVKRSGVVVSFCDDRIRYAVTAAFCDEYKIAKDNALSSDLVERIDELVDKVVLELCAMHERGECIHIEKIQDTVEICLMKHGYYDVARSYILYRKERQKERLGSKLSVYRKKRGTVVKFSPKKITFEIEQGIARYEKLNKDIISRDMKNTIVRDVIASVVALGENDVICTSKIDAIITSQLKKYGLYVVSKIDALEGIQNIETFDFLLDDGKKHTIAANVVRENIKFACRDFPGADIDALLKLTWLNFYNGMKERDIVDAMIYAVTSQIEKDPIYAHVAARILCDNIYHKVLQSSLRDSDVETIHREYFKNYIKQAIFLGRLDERLIHFSLEKLAGALDISRDKNFKYNGLKIIFDRYLLRKEKALLETPQIFWMRVAMGLSLNEDNKNERAIEFYNVLSKFDYTAATPTLFNSGTVRPQLSSCFLTTVKDDLHHIFKSVHNNAMLSKWAGGLGNDWTNVRSNGSLICGTNGLSKGVIPFLKVIDSTMLAVDQGGKRKGVSCAYLEVWHLDIEDFLELRKNTGDERRRTHNTHTANWICDLFIKRVIADDEWTLFSPVDVPDLHSSYGALFEKRYLAYEKQVADGKITLYKKIFARDLWKKMLSMLFETGHPWITFKDPSNVRSVQDHVGVVNSSNLCTEIMLNTSEDEIAVCNLGSINLAQHVADGHLDREKIKNTVTTAMRMLDNVIDINFYALEEAKNANIKHRPVGLGIMGFQDALYKNGIGYATKEAVEFADESTELISYYAILASSNLAKERGKYSSYYGSKWDRGYLPIDTIDLLEKERNRKIAVDRSMRCDWSYARLQIKRSGMRNSQLMAIAPNATIANIIGVTQCIEPTYNNLYVKSNLSGEFTYINHHLVALLKELNMWDEDMIDDLKYFDGSILEIARIPQHIKKVYLTAFEIEPHWLIEAGARRQKWVDMGQSLNLFIDKPSGKKLSDMYISAWEMGLKSTYYLRSTAATRVEASARDINKRAIQPRWMKNSSSSDLNVSRCDLSDGCESCQ